MPRLLTTTRRRAAPAFAGVALALAACGSSTPRSSTTTLKASVPGGTSATTLPTSGGSTASRLAELTQHLQAQTTPYKAVYTSTDSGRTDTVTIEQDPPKSFFGVSEGRVIDTGTGTYFCTTTSTVTCLSSTVEDPLTALLKLFSPQATIDSLRSAQSALATKTAGYSASFSSETFAGQPSTCVTLKTTAGTEKVCVTARGELAYVSTAAIQVFQLTSYSNHVDPSDFALPAGATLMTLPAS